MLTLQEIRQLSVKALRDEIVTAQNDLLKVQFDVRTGSSKESHKVRQLKKYIAQLKTIEKESGSPMVQPEKEEAVEVKTEVKAEKKVRKTTTSKVSRKKV